MNSTSLFDSTAHFTSTLPPNPNWKPGQGVNGVACSGVGQGPFTMIEPGTTEIDPKMLYKVMLGGISPRPIALVGTYGESGLPNVAPMSWYNMLSHDPPLVMVSFGGMRERIKDSERNILRSKHFTISCCTEAYAEAVNHAAINAPSGVSEFALTGLTPVPARLVNAPRVGEAPFSMELELEFTKQWENESGDRATTLVVGRVKMIHVRNDVTDESGGIDPAKLRPVSRFSGTTYGRSVLGFDLTLPRWESYKDQTETQIAMQRGPKEPSADMVAEKQASASRYP